MLSKKRRDGDVSINIFGQKRRETSSSFQEGERKRVGTEDPWEGGVLLNRGGKT